MLNKSNIVCHLLTTLPYTIVFVFVGHIVSFGFIVWDIIPRSLIISYVLGFICGAFIPLGIPASIISSIVRFKTGSYGWYVFSTIIFELEFSIFMGLTTSWINMCIFDTYQFTVATLFGLKYVPLNWIIACIICASTDHNLNRLGCKICHSIYTPPYNLPEKDF